MNTRTVETVNAVSLDADGCVFNFMYNILEKNSIIKANKVLIEYLTSLLTVNSITANKLFVGSLRQNDRNDKFNASNNYTFSFFLEMESLHNHLVKIIEGLELVKLLTADIKSKMHVGYAFDKALGRIQDGLPHPNYLIDQSKISLLYLQMHFLAKDHPQANINFYFFDDRNDVLQTLCDFYGKYPELMPRNLKLNLRNYRGKLVVKFELPIQGTGPIDTKYMEGFNDMIKSCTRQDLNTLHVLEIRALPSRFNIEIFKRLRKLEYPHTTVLTSTSAVMQSLQVSPSIEEEKKHIADVPRSEAAVTKSWSEMFNDYVSYFWPPFFGKTAALVVQSESNSSNLKPSYPS